MLEDIGQGESKTASKPGGALAPLKDPTYRSIWSASLLSNFGILILSVGAAWEMTRLTTAPEMVALVQSAMMLPLMLVAVPAGAIADLFDRRRVALTGLCIAMMFAAILTVIASAGLTTPWLLLGFCSLIGVGTAIYGPAWQASIPEQVKPDDLPAAIALGAVSYNVARSFGPAIGGAIVLAAGANAAFGVNAVSYIPLTIALLLWKRKATVSNHPRERLDRAIVSGARFVRHSPRVRTVVIRAFAAGAAGASITALTPLIARDMLHGDAGTFGFLLGAYGVGAVAGALVLGRLLSRWPMEPLLRFNSAAAGVLILLVSLSHNVFLTAALMMMIGATWMCLAAILNVSVQLSTPSWVTARALAWYQSALTGGVAIGAWFWGYLTGLWGLEAALAISGVVVLATPLIGMVMPMPETKPSDVAAVTFTHEPEVALPLTPRSGPISIEIDYQVTPEQAEEFLSLMQAIQSSRLRVGAFAWSLERDIANTLLWTERYHYPTWGDYLRQRSRFTESDHQLYRKSGAFRLGPETNIRRRLERPPGASGRDKGPIGIFTP
jgi:MFS family permease